MVCQAPDCMARSGLRFCICIALPVLDEPTCHGRASFFVISQTAAVIAIARLLFHVGCVRMYMTWPQKAHD